MSQFFIPFRASHKFESTSRVSKKAIQVLNSGGFCIAHSHYTKIRRGKIACYMRRTLSCISMLLIPLTRRNIRCLHFCKFSFRYASRMFQGMFDTASEATERGTNSTGTREKKACKQKIAPL